MTEDFIQYVWKMKLLDVLNLRTVDGMPVEIIQTGLWNRDSGPDFLNARLKIGSTEWAGNVELHLKTSDWDRHNHSDDAAYNNVVLHVVYENDSNVEDDKMPILELRKSILSSAEIGYRNLMEQTRELPCEPWIAKVPDVITSAWLERIFVERLEEKVSRIQVLLERSNNDKAEVFHTWLARYFGAPQNAEPFERLATIVRLSTVLKHKPFIHQLEALLFGSAGFFDDFVDDYYWKKLQLEFEHLKRLHAIEPMQVHEWKFSRMRPGAFPTVRIALLASLLHRTEHLYANMLNADSTKALGQLFDVKPSDYWLNHYHFGKPLLQTPNVPLNTILINAVVPFVFLEGKQRNDEALTNRALEIARSLPPEDNHVTRVFARAGLKPQNALESQAMLQLKINYCDLRRCLHCSVGHTVIKN
ncbi:MAG TPA: DUF2851 family protein [Chitinophagales bacterium]|nr:DUF2851 family protein [Chitinophagales bacterium]